LAPRKFDIIMDFTNKVIVAKSIHIEMNGYSKWTIVSPFLACVLVGVIVKYKTNLRDLTNRKICQDPALEKAIDLLT
jgi:hypothetical protein